MGVKSSLISIRETLIPSNETHLFYPITNQLYDQKQFSGTLFKNVPTELYSIIDYYLLNIHKGIKIKKCIDYHRNRKLRYSLKCYICNFDEGIYYLGHDLHYACENCVGKQLFVSCDDCLKHCQRVTGFINPTFSITSMHRCSTTSCMICFGAYYDKCCMCKSNTLQLKCKGIRPKYKKHYSIDNNNELVEIIYIVCEDCDKHKQSIKKNLYD